jgi:hypothetical protein
MYDTGELAVGWQFSERPLWRRDAALVGSSGSVVLWGL